MSSPFNSMHDRTDGQLGVLGAAGSVGVADGPTVRRSATGRSPVSESYLSLAPLHGPNTRGPCTWSVSGATQVTPTALLRCPVRRVRKAHNRGDGGRLHRRVKNRDILGRLSFGAVDAFLLRNLWKRLHRPDTNPRRTTDGEKRKAESLSSTNSFDANATAKNRNRTPGRTGTHPDSSPASELDPRAGPFPFRRPSPPSECHY